MKFAKVQSAQSSLLKSFIIDVEVDLSRGLHSFSVVGLPDKAVEEARDRISAAIKNSGYKSPKTKNEKVVISLAPADVKKEGSNFDLAMALAYLLASEEIKFDAKNKLFLGELSLDGKLRPIQGTLPLVAKARELGYKEIYLPKANAEEAAILDNIDIFPSETLSDVISHLKEGSSKKLEAQPKTEIVTDRQSFDIDMNDVRGQESAKRGLEIAAAGGHNIAMWGPPGTGKTMLSRAFAGILPPLDFDEILEVTSIHSVAGILKGSLVKNPPFRSPHHTASHVSVVGGGTNPRPGEITLAHRGVLFMDEFPEFEHRVIESLREPLEDRVVSISRAKGSAVFPAHFILIASMNPCPCGNSGTKGKICVCSASALEKYRRKLSGPIIDRIDMWVEVGPVEIHKLSSSNRTAENSFEIRKRVERARQIQKARFEKNNLKLKTNSEMSVRTLDKILQISDEAKELLNSMAKKLDLSGRSYHRVQKLARTIADLSEEEEILPKHVSEAMSYRPKQQIN